MKSTEPVQRIFLWILVMLTGIQIGATVYEMRVLVPLWASAPPGTVRAYDAVVSAYPSYAPDPEPRFWKLATPATGMVALLVFALGLIDNRPSRTFLLLSSGTILVLILSSYFFFAPTLARLNDQTLSYDEVTRLVELWVSLNWGRTVLFMGAWGLAIWSLIDRFRSSSST